MTAKPESIFSLAGNLCTRMNSLGLSQERIDGIKRGADPEFWTQFDHLMRGEMSQGMEMAEILLQITSWTTFYKKFFDISLDVRAFKIPNHVEGFDRLIVIAKGISLNKVWGVHAERNIQNCVWCGEDIESVMQESERGKVKSSYAFWVRDQVEADEDLKNLSTVQINEQKIDTENLLERLVHGLKCYDETYKHLDVNNITLCASSRYADGFVPSVDRDGDGVYVRGYDPQVTDAVLRARRAVR